MEIIKLVWVNQLVSSRIDGCYVTKSNVDGSSQRHR